MDDQARRLEAKLRTQRALMPTGRDERVSFLADLIDDVEDREMIATRRPGFREKSGFVMPHRMLGCCDGRYIWKDDQSFQPPGTGYWAGTLEEWQQIGRIARHSSLLSIGIMAALAAPLLSYVGLQSKRQASVSFLPESVIFNMSGPSASGKTTAAKVAASVLELPEAMGKWDASRRGFEEYLASRNDLLAILDDTEKCTQAEGRDSLRRAMRTAGQLLPDGRGRLLSDIAADQGVAPLSWSTIGLSTSPKPIQTIAEELGWTISEGELVRFIDIPVQSRDHGGIFDQLTVGPLEYASEGTRLIVLLEAALPNQFGTLLPA